MPVSKETIDAIRSHLNQAATWAHAIQATINNPETLWFAVLARELFKELNFLDRLLTYPVEQIPAEFKKRCEYRLNTPDECISIIHDPNTITNTLYITIARLLFNQSDLKLLIEILLPTIKRCIYIQDTTPISSNTTAKEIKAAFDHSDVTLQTDDLSFLSGVRVTETSLSDCVFIDDAVFPLAQTLPIAPSITWQTKWFRALAEYRQYPGLKEKIEAHNGYFRELKNHVDRGFVGFTATDLFNYLIHGLRRAGSRVTHQEYAHASILTVLNHFFDDFRRLPELVQNQLKALPMSYHWANVGVLLSELETDSICVETSAETLEAVLDRYKNDPLFTTRHHINGSKTNPFSIDWQNKLSKTIEENKHLPSLLVLQLLKHIEIIEPELLLWLIKLLPVSAYSALIDTLQSSLCNEPIQAFLRVCRNDALSDEQKSGLLAGIVSYVFTSTNDESMIIRLIKDFNGSSQSINNLAALVHALKVPLVKFTDGNHQNLLHFIAAHATYPHACLKQLSDPAKIMLSVQKDNQGHYPIHLARSTHDFNVLLRYQPEAKRLSFVLDANHQLCPLIFNEASARTLLDLLTHLSKTDQIRFLRAKTKTGQRVIEDIIALNNPSLFNVEASQLNKLFTLLTVRQFKNKTTFIDVVLRENTWENIEARIRALLIAEITEDKYICRPVFARKIDHLLALFNQIHISLTADDYIAFIRDVANTPPTPASMVKLGCLLEPLMSQPLPCSRFALLMQNNAELFNLLINHSLHRKHHHKVIFNPYLFYIFIEILRKNNDTESLTGFLNTRVALGSSSHLELSVKELLIKDLVRLYKSLATSTPLLLDLISKLFSLEMTEIPAYNITSSAMVWIRKFFNDAATKPDSEAILKALTSHFAQNILRINASYYIKLLKRYAECLVLVEKSTTAERSSIEQEYLSNICTLLNGNQPYETLALLNLKPIGATRTIQSQLSPHIKRMMQVIEPIADAYSHGQPLMTPDESAIRRVIHNILDEVENRKPIDLPKLEIILQFVPISIKDVLKAAFRSNAIEVIQHLLESYRDALQTIHREKHLISLYLKCEHSFSAEIPLLLNHYGFQIASTERPLPNDDLSRCLQKTCEKPIRDSEQAILLITELQKAGADFNAVNHLGFPPLFYAFSNITIARALIQLGADVNFITQSGENILSHSIKSYQKMEHQFIDYPLIEMLIRAGIKSTILNRRNIIVYNQYMTILGFLLQNHMKLRNERSRSDSRNCMLAALEAGATPFFFTEEHHWAYRIFQKGIFPDNDILKAQANNYPQLMRDQTELLAIIKALTVALAGYRRHISSRYEDVSCMTDIYSFDIKNKINLLQTALVLCRSTYSLEDAKNTLNTLIKKFVDSDTPGIITVARFPQLPSHKCLFTLIGSFSPEAIPSPADYPTPEFPHLIMGPIPIEAIKNPRHSMVFLKLCAPAQFASVNFYQLFADLNAYQHRQVNDYTFLLFWSTLENWFASLNNDQLIACITQMTKDRSASDFHAYCYHNMPVLFLYQLKVLAIQNDPELIKIMHTRYPDKWLLDKALLDSSKPFKMNLNSALGQKLEDYFEYRKSLLTELRVIRHNGPTLFEGSQKKVEHLREALHKLSKFSDESLFTHFKSENKPTTKHKA